MRVLILIASLLHVTFAAPQFVTFKDGKIGVNFAGYHAAAGLGGLLTGNAAHGGLSASAGTPWGPQAAAGLNGNVDGRTNGVLYAGAQANPEVGASAVLGGAAGEGGFGGSESHSYGKTASKTITGYHQHVDGNVAVAGGPPPAIANDVPRDTSNVIQKVKPPKKYSLIKSEHQANVNADVNVAHSKHITRNVQKTVQHAPPATVYGPESVESTGTVGVRVNSGIVGQALQIPIGILRSLQESLAGIQVDKSFSYKSNAAYGAN